MTNPTGSSPAYTARNQARGSKWASAIDTALGATNLSWPGATRRSQTSRTVSFVISRSSTPATTRILAAVHNGGRGPFIERPSSPEARMEYRTLGRTGVKVSTHCLGTMMFGPWGNTDEGQCVRMINDAIDAGI